MKQSEESTARRHRHRHRLPSSSSSAEDVAEAVPSWNALREQHPDSLSMDSGEIEKKAEPMTWTKCEAKSFRVRDIGYFTKNKAKTLSAPPIFEMFGVAAFSADRRVPIHSMMENAHFLQNAESTESKAPEAGAPRNGVSESSVSQKSKAPKSQKKGSRTARFSKKARNENANEMECDGQFLTKSKSAAAVVLSTQKRRRTLSFDESLSFRSKTTEALRGDDGSASDGMGADVFGLSLSDDERIAIESPRKKKKYKFPNFKKRRKPKTKADRSATEQIALRRAVAADSEIE